MACVGARIAGPRDSILITKLEILSLLVDSEDIVKIVLTDSNAANKN